MSKYVITCSNELYHHGILGQKWGIRRYQNTDGTLTDAGRKRYNVKSFNGKDAKDAIRLIKDRRNQRLTNALVTAGLATATVGGALGSAIATKNPYVGTSVAYAGAAAISIQADDAKRRLSTENSLSDDRIYIPQGSKLNRTSLDESENLNAKQVYVTIDKSHQWNKYYEKVWPERLQQFANDPEAKVYKNTFEVKADLVAPSKEERVKMLSTMLKNDVKLRQEFGKEFVMQQLRIRTGNYNAKSYKDFVKNEGDTIDQGYSWIWNDKKLAKKAFDYQVANADSDFLRKINKKTLNKIDNLANDYTTVIAKSPKLMTRYAKELKKQGYNCVFDDNSRAVADAPIIVFDPKALEQIGSKRLT